MTQLQAVSQLEAESLAFFDPESEIYGIADRSIALLFKNGKILAHSDATVVIETTGSASWSARMTAMQGSFELVWTAHGPSAPLDAGEEMRCVVSGTVTESDQKPQVINCLGTATMTTARPGPPVVRALAAVFDQDNAVLMNGYKPAVYHGHGDERNDAVLIENGIALPIRETRISTLYDGNDRHVQAHLELFVGEDEFPRRLTGEAIEGARAELPGREVNLAFYEWRMGPRTGSGFYEIALATRPRTAA